MPETLSEASMFQFKSFLAQLEYASVNLESPPTIRVQSISTKSKVDFVGRSWRNRRHKDSESNEFAKEIVEAVNDLEASTEDLHVHLQVSIDGKASEYSQMDVGNMSNRNQGGKKSIDKSTSYRLLSPFWSFDDIALASKTSAEIQRALALVQFKDLIYEEWGMKEVEPFPICALNFFGPSGTGKTMAAHAVAHQLERNLLMLSVAEIESKYVGESPKNLADAFEFAKSMKAVLFFDEADSILGKRIPGVSQGSEQAINSLRSQMLVSLDSFEGIAIFATNLVATYDFAFANRIHHVQFHMPGYDERRQIWGKHLPPKLPVESEINLNKLAAISEGFSGRDIKNTVTSAIGRIVLEARDILEEEDLLSAIAATKSKVSVEKESV
jgi:SpoVK/Ycf46/Vps4 family AAA+-type ATPase